MEEEKKGNTLFPRKRSFTFGAYGSFGCDHHSVSFSDFLVDSVEQSGDEAGADNAMDVLDSPVYASKPVLSASNSQKETELFEIIEKLQGSRLDEQRCEFPLPLKSQLLTIGGELPIILPSKVGRYWIDPPLETLAHVSPTPSRHGLQADSYELMERDAEAKIYHNFFRSRYHHSFTAVDPTLGPLVVSVCLEEEENRMRVILRMREGSRHGVFSLSPFHGIPSSVELAKMLCDRLTVSRFEAVTYLKAPVLISAFDEHRMSSNFKFGVLYQKENQLTEEDILSNNEESEPFTDFLSILGDTVQLQGFTGFRGGLDVCHGQTGSEAVFTSFHGREVLFHVATKLPFTEGDPQQLQRKRHIGNDIVALVYQEGPTPFLADAIQSHFLHCFIVVRRVPSGKTDDTGRTAYQISVTAREDVPLFGPVLPDPPIFTDHCQLREFLLTKLINAEISCYKAEQFSRLELRTRSSLLESLQAELSTRSHCMLGDPSSSSLPAPESVRGVSEGTGGFIENFKRAMRVRSHSFETLGAPKKISGISPQKPKADKDGESDCFAPSEVKDPASPQEET
ncbi:rap1 GTPase-activating protein 2 [Syngnathoides biaculeatus]|uniref:rap1 GTPase-activating protein 2 n=1 Tax=Syngnathoides biaculeatus TaxID=300417 RepID=UPI002ADE41CE|nr:rap1 GTPase-activating protein 2 [Syngnathoides biaculeatus]